MFDIAACITRGGEICSALLGWIPVVVTIVSLRAMNEQWIMTAEHGSNSIMETPMQRKLANDLRRQCVLRCS